MTESALKITIPAESRMMSLVDQSTASWFMAADGAQVLASEMSPVAEFAASGDAFWDDENLRRFRPYNVIRSADGSGVLVVPVRGSLIADFPYQAGVYATGYEYITAAVRRGAADPTIKSILLDVNSPGGMVRGCYECGLAISQATKSKPVIAYAAEMMASAAYWIGSQASSVHVSNTGEVGSIGVITGHFDESEWLKSWGVKYTPIFAGERKADGSPYLPLTDEAKAGIQKRINHVYAEFISAVAAGRKMDGNDIRNTQAAMFPAREAVRNGLADAISTRDQVIRAALGAKAENQAEQVTNEGTEDMNDKTKDEAKTIQADASLLQNIAAGLGVSYEDLSKNLSANSFAGVKAAIAAPALARVQEILGCAEAVGREAQANVFAFKTDLAVDQVKQLLAAAPVSAPAQAAAPNAFEAAMAGTPNPNVGAGADTSAENDGVMAAMLASFK